MSNILIQGKEAVAKRCSVKKVFLEISQNSLENTCARVSFLIKLQISGGCLFTKQYKQVLHLCFKQTETQPQTEIHRITEEQLHGPGSSNDPKLIDKTSKRATRRSTDMKNFALTSLFCSCHEEKVNLHQLEASKDRTLRQRLSEGDKHRALSNASSRTVHHEDDIMKGNC